MPRVPMPFETHTPAPALTCVRALFQGTVSEGSKRRERKGTSAQEEVAQEIAKAKGLSSSKHGKGRKHCDPLAGLFKSGLVSPC